MKNKLSPIERLRADRLALNEEIKVHEDKLKNNLSYAKHNWGSLLLSSVVSSSTNSVKSLFGMGDDNSSDFKSSWLDKAMLIAPMAWGIIQPILLGLVTKKITSLFFGKKKSKSKK